MDQQIHLSQAGTQIAVVQCESDIVNISFALNYRFKTLVVYDDVSEDGKGTEWEQVGETLHGLYSLKFTDPELLLDFSDWAEQLKFKASPFGLPPPTIDRNQTAGLFGSTKGEYLGMSLSISPGGDFLAVSSYDGIKTFGKNQEGNWKRYGNLFGRPTQQRECCFDRKPSGENIAILADGKRVVGGTPLHR